MNNKHEKIINSEKFYAWHFYYNVVYLSKALVSNPIFTKFLRNPFTVDGEASLLGRFRISCPFFSLPGK